MGKYKGQSLAIVLVLLIVGSIIGFALYARAVRDAERTVEERAASEANELTETLVGLINTSEYQNIKEGFVDFTGCDEDGLYTTEGCREHGMNLSRLVDFFEGKMAMDISEGDLVSFNRDLLGDDYCLTEMSMRYGLGDDEVIIEQDDAFSLFFNKVENWDNCNISFVMSNGGNADGFVLSTFYGEHDGDDEITSYKNYQTDDIKGYKYSGSGDNWLPYTSGSTEIEFNSSNASKSGHDLHEVRFKSLGDFSTLKWDMNDGCNIENYLKMEIISTCGGRQAGKKFVVPTDVFAPPVFDYVLFNGEGKIEPEAIDPDRLQ